MAKKINYIAGSKKGVSHNFNEDNYIVIDQDDYYIFAVFDGVGSALNAKEATQIAKRFIKANYLEYLQNSIKLNNLMFDLNIDLCDSGLVEPYSTYCLVVSNKTDSHFYYSWLGDSRIYSITNQFIEQITYDDSFSENIITKYLGNKLLSIDDFRQIKSNREEKYLLICTDGFYKILEENKLQFFDMFLMKRLATIKNKIDVFIKGKNIDDSTYIFIK